MSLCVPRIDQKLKSIGVEGVDRNPAAHDEGKITNHAVEVLPNDLPSIGKPPDEQSNGEESEEEKEIAVERFHTKICRGLKMMARKRGGTSKAMSALVILPLLLTLFADGGVCKALRVVGAYGCR